MRRSARYPTARLVLPPLLVFLACSCRLAPPSYSLRAHWPHKDVLALSVDVDQRLSVDDYLEIVDRETSKLLSRPGQREAPIYEVRVDFFLPSHSAALRQRVARVILRSAPPEGSTQFVRLASSREGLEHAEVVLY